MQVRDALAGVRADVGDHPVAPGGLAALAGDARGGRGHRSGQLGVGLRERWDVPLRDDEDVERRDRASVAEGEHRTVLVDDLRGQLPPDDLAEEALRVVRAVGHVDPEYGGVDLPAAVAAYLVGSISFPWLVALGHGFDLRAVGSRKLGGSNLTTVLGVRWGLLGGGLDALKGTLVVLAAGAIGLPIETRVLCGLAAVAGQMWPIFHDLDGGRANATGWGVLIALDPLAALIAAIPLGAAVAGRAAVRPRPTRIVPLASLLTFLVWSAAIYETSGVTSTVTGGLAIFVLILVRRLTAGIGKDLGTGAPLGRVIVNRALYDRSELQERGTVAI